VINAEEIDGKMGGEDDGEATIKVTLEDGRSFTVDDHVYFG
jgi:hypothetical protein